MINTYSCVDTCRWNNNRWCQSWHRVLALIISVNITSYLTSEQITDIFDHVFLVRLSIFIQTSWRDAEWNVGTPSVNSENKQNSIAPTMSWASCQNVFPPPHATDPDMPHGTCVMHVPWCMPGSLTSGIIERRWRGKRSRHSRRMHNAQFCISGKRPMQ